MGTSFQAEGLQDFQDQVLGMLECLDVTFNSWFNSFNARISGIEGEITKFEGFMECFEQHFVRMA